MRQDLATATRWMAVGIVGVLAAVAPATSLRVAVLALGGLSLVPLLGWARSVSFTPPLAAAAGALSTAVLLAAGQVVPVALAVAVAAGVAVGSGLTVATQRIAARLQPWVSLLVLLTVTAVGLPRLGLIAAPRPLMFGIDLGGDRALAVTGVLLVGGAVAVTGNVTASRLRREIVAAAVAPAVAVRSGVVISAALARAGGLAGAVAALAGALLTLDLQALPPGSQFGLATGVTWLAVAVVGGAAWSTGPVIAALLIGGGAAVAGVPDIAVAGLAFAVAAMGGERGLFAIPWRSGAGR